MVKNSFILCLVLCFVKTDSIAQLTTYELSNIYTSLQDKSVHFKVMIEDFNTYSLELIGESVELLSNEKTTTLEEIPTINEELNEIFNAIDSEYKILYEKIEKDMPYVPYECVQYYELFKQLYSYLDQIQAEFSSNIENAITAFDEHFGKEDLRKIKDPENGDKSIFETITSFPVLRSKEVVDFFNKQKDEDLDFLQRSVLSDNIIYENQTKFMKKNKLDSLWGFYATEGSNPFFVRSAKTGKLGYYEAGYDFNINNIEEIFPPVYDSIQRDDDYDDWGICLWTTAIGYKNGEAIVKQKVFDEEGDVYESSEFITYTSMVANVTIPPRHSNVHGILTVVDSAGMYYHVNPKTGEALTPKYLKKEMLPLVLQGKLNTDCRIKFPKGNIKYGSIWPYEKQSYIYKICYRDTTGFVSWFSDTTGYYTFFNDGSLQMVSYHKGGYESYYDGGEKNSISTADSLIVYYPNGNLKYVRQQKDYSATGAFRSYYPDGVIHEEGYLKEGNVDSAYISYYHNGNIKSRGTYNGWNKLDDWVYNNPFGVSGELAQTQVKFPTNFFDTTYSLRVQENVHDHIALVRGNIPDYTKRTWDFWGSIEYYQLWDTKNIKLLEAAIPMALQVDGFYGKDLVYGQSLKGDYIGTYSLSDNHYVEPWECDSGHVASEAFLTKDPLRVGDELGLACFDKTLKLYDLKNYQVVAEFSSQQEESRNIDLMLDSERKSVHFMDDVNYYELSIPELKVLKKFDIKEEVKDSSSVKRWFLKNAIISFRDHDEYAKAITDIRIRNLDRLEKTIEVETDLQLNWEYSSNNGGIVFKMFNEKDPTYFVLDFDFEKGTYNFEPVELYTKDSNAFDPRPFLPARRLYFTLGERNEKELKLSEEDTVSVSIALASGKVEFIENSATPSSGSEVIPSYKNEALIYLQSLEMSGENNFDKVQDHEVRSIGSDPTKHIYITGNKVKRVIFQNEEKKALLDQFVFFDINEDSDYLFLTPDQYYLASKDIKDLVFFKSGNEYFEFEQFDLKYNRPDIILDRLGYADSSLVAAYYAAYQKRLKKMGFTEEMLQDDFHLPEIEIENFEEMPQLHDQGSINLKLNLKDSKYKLDRINVWVNDVAIYGTNGISLRNKNVQEYQAEFEVFLAKGKNKVQVSVLNQAGAESYKETFEIECTIGKDKPDLYLISIGESEFQQSDFNLTYAAKDAKDMVSLFEKSKVYENVFTKTLVNDQVTKANVMALKSFLEKAGINDEVMIFIAGHGVLDANLDYYFATYDMDFMNPADKGLAYEDLESLLDGIKPLKKTLLIDACHSGEIDKDEVELAEADVEETDDIQFRVVGNKASPKLGTQNTSELTKSLFTDLRKGTGATVISSAGGMEFAIEGDDWNNGLFTYCFINGIKSKEADLNGDKEIWLSEIQQYVSQQVYELSGGRQQPTSRIENQTIDFRVW
jgi:hypothetical protein